MSAGMGWVGARKRGIGAVTRLANTSERKFIPRSDARAVCAVHTVRAVRAVEM